MNLQTRIREIVHEHSGGVKLVTLTVELTSSYLREREAPPDPDLVLETIEDDDTLDALEYVWNMVPPYAEGVHREKVFVHQI